MCERLERWDVEAGTMIGVYASQAAALAEVRDLLQRWHVGAMMLAR